MLADSSGKNEAVDSAICEYLLAMDAGDSFDVQAWLTKHLEIREDLLAFLDDQALASNSAVLPPSPDTHSSTADLEMTTDFASGISPAVSGSLSASRNSGVDRTQGTSHPTAVGDIQLGRLLGSGGMGRVYEGIDSSGQRVAVKLLAPHWTKFPESISRFRKEGALASMINHPRCVFVKAADTDNGVPYIIMELMPGDTLKDLVSRQGPLPYRQAVQLILDVAEGLEEAHSRGMIHRDVKPANCYLESNGRVKIGDFGLARSVLQPSDLTVTGGFVGTPLYASPEQIRGKQLDARTDIYSLSATLYYLLTGRAPFASDNPTQTIARIVSEEPPNVRDEVADCPIGLERVLQRGLAREPDKRHQTVIELMDALRPFVEGGPVSAPIGSRIGAMLVDTGVYSIFTTAVVFIHSPQLLNPDQNQNNLWLVSLAGTVVWFFYLLLQELLTGATIGKRLFRLEVVDAATRERAAWYQILPRTTLYLVATGLLSEWLLYLWDTSVITGVGYLSHIASSLIGYFLLLATYPIRSERALAHDWLTQCRVVSKNRVTGEELPWNAQVYTGTRLPQNELGSIGRFKILAKLTDDTNVYNDRQVLLGVDPQLDRHVWLVSVSPKDESGATAFGSVDNANPSRTTRLRKIQTVSGGGQEWVVYSAIEGESVEQRIARGAKLAWPQVHSLLSQLTVELLAAYQTQPTTGLRSLSQLWIDLRGRLVVLDFPLNPTIAPSATPLPAPQLALQMASGLLALKNQEKVRVDREPLPVHAVKILEKLQTIEASSAGLQELQSQLLTTQKLPHRIELKHRFVQLALICALLAGVFGATLSLSRIGNQIAVSRAGDALLASSFARKLHQDVDLYQDWVQRVTAASALTATRPLPSQSQLAELAGQIDQKYAAEYRMRYTHLTVWHTMILKASPYRSNLIEERDSYTVTIPKKPEEDYLFSISSNPGVGRSANLSAMDLAKFYSNEEWKISSNRRRLLFIVALSVSQLIIVMLWDFAFRGGWSAWIAGIRYVDVRNRPAGFARFAVRTLLIWIPVITLGMAITYLDCQPTESSLQSADILNILYTLVPVPAILLTLLYPTRQLHDRLTGVYPVPR